MFAPGTPCARFNQPPALCDHTYVFVCQCDYPCTACGLPADEHLPLAILSYNILPTSCPVFFPATIPYSPFALLEDESVA